MRTLDADDATLCRLDVSLTADDERVSDDDGDGVGADVRPDAGNKPFVTAKVKNIAQTVIFLFL